MVQLKADCKTNVISHGQSKRNKKGLLWEMMNLNTTSSNLATRQKKKESSIRYDG